MRRKRFGSYSGIGGQAVLEGIMMKNKDQYAVAVRKPNGEIEVEVDVYHGVMHGSKIKNIPFLRGIFNFLDSLILGTRTLNFSASFYEEEEDTKKKDTFFDKMLKGNAERILMGMTTVFAVVLAIAVFIVLPYFLADCLRDYIRNDSLMAIIEGAIRILIFLLYVISISAMKDIKRVYQYHGAEHKCINCIEHGLPLTVENVRSSSRQHKRCGTSFLFLVLAISIIMLVLVRAETPLMRIVIRIVLLPVIAGVSYELLKLAGRSDNLVVNLFSKPGLAIQKLTTKEPDDGMIEVAIQAVEAVFDWRTYEAENFHTAADH